MLQALGTLSGLLTSPEAAGTTTITLSQHKSVTCLAGSIGNHLLLRNSTFQVTLEVIRRVLFLPQLLSVCPRAPGQGCRVLSAPSPAHQDEGNTASPHCNGCLSADYTLLTEDQTYFLFFGQAEFVHFLRTQYHSMHHPHDNCFLTP